MAAVIDVVLRDRKQRDTETDRPTNKPNRATEGTCRDTAGTNLECRGSRKCWDLQREDGGRGKKDGD